MAGLLEHLSDHDPGMFLSSANQDPWGSVPEIQSTKDMTS